ncbi:hypothetical protein I6I18_05975 [Kytococcus sedentarius]|uniref:Coenzyme PQQ synthesis protein D (PqqD) n=1 Tax=Kytococcus sedentarius (strain ATCC 14392 / DSM 20547 / JCM 11482 / CCUG 33030 / NBRC 15357 / NCTC 11040 / CCM 314 / 541) TaxID=478801 RepID=C7NIL9_KYTSD|nr:PqqD family protein [Kytococcus sedentarius]ACV06657.1 hypothetical protein Ksed_16420 [Kytococcus sedentarius DSM 20547]QQB64949.1 hypothetical protein I6I18_05975 [Kytococcus sedentarius]STX14528.1 Uncharacterised protein [Kytococcus sedentarius]
MTTTGAAPRAGQDGEEGREIARLQVLSTVWSVVDHASGMQDDIPALWARCATEAAPTRVVRLLPAGETAPRSVDAAGVADAADARATHPATGEPARLPEQILTVTDEQSGYRFASRVISSSIAEHVGKALMLHAGALTVAGGDRAVALVAASGTGKTTASRVLAQQGWGYLTDECVAVGEDLTIQPLAKPLSVVTDPAAGGHLKHQVGPDELGMAEPGESAVLAGMVLLRRLRNEEEVARDGGILPRLDEVDLAEALGRLAPQTSALSRTPGGLARLAQVVREVGVVELVYSEIEQASGLLADWVAGQAHRPRLPADEPDVLVGGAPWDQVLVKPGEVEALTPSARCQREDHSSAVLTTDGQAVVMTGSEVTQLGPLGRVLWERLAEPRALGELQEALVEAFGEHPDAPAITAEALASLRSQGLVRVV